MRYRQLGSTGTQVSVLCLGAMTFGEADEKSFMHKVGSTKKRAFAVLDRALAAGINFVDTADVYGQDGLSERVLGRWLAVAQGAREDRAGDQGSLSDGEGPTAPALRDAHPARHRRQPDETRTDRIDLYQIHMQDIRTPEEELLRALDDAMRAGKIAYIGCSNYAAYRLVESLWIADKRNSSASSPCRRSTASRSQHRARAQPCAPCVTGSASCPGRRSPAGS